MRTLKAAYMILNRLEHKKRDRDMVSQIGPAALKMEENDWLDVMRELTNAKYIAGVLIMEDMDGEADVDLEDARITLRGAEYLRTNSTMRQIAKAAGNVVSIIKP